MALQKKLPNGQVISTSSKFKVLQNAHVKGGNMNLVLEKGTFIEVTAFSQGKDMPKIVTNYKDTRIEFDAPKFSKILDKHLERVQGVHNKQTKKEV